MGREQRRRAERQQRRRARPPAGAPPAAAVSEAVLREPRHREGSPAPARPTPGPKASTGSARPAPEAPVRAPEITVASTLQATGATCGPVEGLDPQALGVTLIFEAPAAGEPFPLRVRFTGRRTAAADPPAAGDTFDVVDTVAQVIPGSGTVSLTRRIEGVTPGDWTVQAVPVVDRDAPVDRAVPRPARVEASTGYAPLIRVRAPGVRIGAWPALVGSGTAVALALQGLLASRFGLPAGPVLGLSLVACLLGLLGARVYYRLEHPRRPGASAQPGMCIQGFVLAAVGSVVVGTPLLDIPTGRLLDVTAPGLMAGMAVGRVGCFLGGCCAGRPTGSRWGLWSSDRRLGVRRIPTQLFESALAVLVGSVAGGALAVADPRPTGAVFVATASAYTLGRQLLFSLRSLPRHTRYGRTLVMISTGAALVGAELTLLVT